MKLIATIFAALLISQSAYADCESVAGEYRKCFDNDNAPPAVFFRIFVDGVFMAGLDFLEDLSRIEEDLSRIESGPGHAGWHAVKPGLTGRMSSADVVRYFVPKFLEIEQEAHDAQNIMLCSDGVPRYGGAENFVLFNQLDEVYFNVYEKHYYLVRSDLHASGLYDLDKALEESSGGFTLTFENHSLETWGSVNRIYEAAKVICASSWGYRINK